MKTDHFRSSLSHEIMHRKGDKNQSERFSADFIINGHSLIRSLKAEKMDLMGRFVRGVRKSQIESTFFLKRRSRFR
jgi:hypothetical protein